MKPNAGRRRWLVVWLGVAAVGGALAWLALAYLGPVPRWPFTQQPELRAALQGHTGWVYSVAFSPDGKTLASGAQDATIRLWDVGSGQNTATLEAHTFGVLSVAFSPDGQTLASGNRDGTIRLWDVAGRRNTATLVHTRGEFGRAAAMWFVNCVAYSPDGQTLASASFDGTIKLWNVASGQNTATLRGHAADVPSVAYSPDGQTLASASFDGTIKLWNVASSQNVATLQADAEVAEKRSRNNLNAYVTITLQNQPFAAAACSSYFLTAPEGAPRILNVTFSPDGKTLAVRIHASKSPLQLWDVASRKQIASGPHGGLFASLAFSPDGKTLAWGIGGDAIMLWDWAGGPNTAARRILGNPPALTSQGVESVAFSPDGKTLAAGGDDVTVRLWNVAAARKAAE